MSYKMSPQIKIVISEFYLQNVETHLKHDFIFVHGREGVE